MHADSLVKFDILGLEPSKEGISAIKLKEGSTKVRPAPAPAAHPLASLIAPGSRAPPLARQRREKGDVGIGHPVTATIAGATRTGPRSWISLLRRYNMID